MRFTYFQSALDRSASTHELTWGELCAHIKSPPTYASKSECPLIKLGVFGNSPSPKGFLRHDANLTAITGVELDYDASIISIDEAEEKLRKAGVCCMLYTSASHTPEKPRWRVIAPFKAEHPPEYRRGFVTYLDNILGGIVARESYALSQAYYVGRIDGVEYEIKVIEGRCVDELTEAVATPVSTADTPDIPEWRHVELDTLPIDDETKFLIRNGADKGQRSETLMTAANALARARVNPDDILRILSNPAYGISAKALETRPQTAAMEWLAKHTVRKALEKYPPADVVFAEPAIFGEPAKRSKFFASAGELITRNASIAWQINSILERGVLGMVFGDPGAGKSFVTLDIAVCIATGSAWQDQSVEQGTVAYIAGEGFGGIKRRLQAWSLYRQISLDNAPLYVSQRSVNFCDPSGVNELHGELDGLPDRPTLIVIDTLARATPGMDENSAKEVSAFIAACDRLREKYAATVLVVHHSGHSDKGRAKGSIAIKGAVDFEASVTRSSHDKSVVVVKSTKMKDGEPFEDIHLSFVQVELPPTPDLARQSSAVLVEVGKPEKKTALNKTDKLLQEVIDDGFNTEAKAQTEFIRRYEGSDEAKRSAWRRASEKAVARGTWSTAVK